MDLKKTISEQTQAPVTLPSDTKVALDSNVNGATYKASLDELKGYMNLPDNTNTELGDKQDTSPTGTQGWGDSVLIQLVGNVKASTINLYNYLKAKFDLIYAKKSAEEYSIKNNSGCIIDEQEMTFLKVGNDWICEMRATPQAFAITGTYDLRVDIGGVEYLLDCTTNTGTGGRARSSACTLGTSGQEQVNFLYLTESGGVVTFSANVFPPSTQFAWAGTASFRDEADTLDNLGNPYQFQRFRDSLVRNGADRGAISIASERLRAIGTQIASGCQGSVIFDSGGIGQVDVDIAAGQIYQLHLQASSAFTDHGKYIVLNDPSGDLVSVADLSLLTQDANGDPLLVNNSYFALEICLIKNSGEVPDQIGVWLPNGIYSGNQLDLAINDSANLSVTPLPSLSFGRLASRICRVLLVWSNGSGHDNALGGNTVQDTRLSPLGASGGGGGGASGSNVFDPNTIGGSGTVSTPYTVLDFTSKDILPPVGGVLAQWWCVFDSETRVTENYGATLKFAVNDAGNQSQAYFEVAIFDRLTNNGVNLSLINSNRPDSIKYTYDDIDDRLKIFIKSNSGVMQLRGTYVNYDIDDAVIMDSIKATALIATAQEETEFLDLEDANKQPTFYTDGNFITVSTNLNSKDMKAVLNYSQKTITFFGKVEPVGTGAQTDLMYIDISNEVGNGKSSPQQVYGIYSAPFGSGTEAVSLVMSNSQIVFSNFSPVSVGYDLHLDGVVFDLSNALG